MKKIKKYLLQKKFKKKNVHNNTWMANIFDIDKVKIGIGTYGPLFVKEYGNKNEALEIGNYCSIAHGVKFLLGGEHNYKLFSTYPFQKKFNIKDNESITKGKIVVEDDVWIGEDSLILSGVKIGKGAVIGAGTIVSKNIPPYAIFAGEQIIKYRFNGSIVKELMKIDFSNITKEKIIKSREILEKEINENNVREIVEMINKEGE